MTRVLFIEDNSDLRENAAEILEMVGYKVITAPNGQVGIELAHKEKPDIIISDVVMPVLNGHQVFEALRKDEQTRNIPFVFVSAYVDPSELKVELKKGEVGYIRKPFDASELYGTIEHFLNKGV